jgi:hypothetical protein
MNYEHTFKNQNFEIKKKEINKIKIQSKQMVPVDKLNSDDYIGNKDDVQSFCCLICLDIVLNP